MKRYAQGIFIGTILVMLFFWSLSYAGNPTTSSITAQTIIDRAERYLDSSSDPFFTDNDYIQWIDEAVKETIERTGCLETARSTIPLVANTNRYTLGSTYLKVQAIEHDNGDTTDTHQVITLARTSNTDIGHGNETGRPQIYAVWNNYIEVWPIPRTEEADTSLYVYSTPLPTGVSATSSAIETPAYLDSAIVYFVVSKAYLKDNQFDRSSKYYDIYEKRISEYTASIIQRKPLE